MTLTQLEIFSTVAARRGFTAAALQLGISQSGVSHAIEALHCRSPATGDFAIGRIPRH